MSWWIIRDRESGECQHVQSDDGPPPYDPDAFDMAELPRAIDDARECWDFEAGSIVLRATSEQAAAEMWERAKVHSANIAAGGFTLVGVGPIQTDEASLTAIRLLVEEARDRIDDGEPDWATEFLNRDNVKVPVTIPEILMINRMVRAFLGAVYDARQAARAVIDAALASGATAAEILEIDITAGYPTDPVSPPLPPSEPES